jgi:hypothetical protein
MNDSPFSYDMLKSLAAQVSQELYRETLEESTPSDLSYRDVVAGIRTRLAAWRQHIKTSWAILSRAPAERAGQM